MRVLSMRLSALYVAGFHMLKFACMSMYAALMSIFFFFIVCMCSNWNTNRKKTIKFSFQQQHSLLLKSNLTNWSKQRRYRQHRPGSRALRLLNVTSREEEKHRVSHCL